MARNYFILFASLEQLFVLSQIKFSSSNIIRIIFYLQTIFQNCSYYFLFVDNARDLFYFVFIFFEMTIQSHLFSNKPEIYFYLFELSSDLFYLFEHFFFI